MGKLKKHLETVVNKAWNYAGRITTEQEHQINAMIGVASEAGELLDIGKKMWYHTKKPFSHYREKMVLEIGDIFFYLLKTMDLFDITLKEVLAKNKEKLESRHPELGVVTERFGPNAIR